jgi:hypothetical protein
MMVYLEKIDPPMPIVPLTAEDRLKLRREEQASDDIWVKNFIDDLAGVIRDLKH